MLKELTDSQGVTTWAKLTRKYNAQLQRINSGWPLLGNAAFFPNPDQVQGNKTQWSRVYILKSDCLGLNPHSTNDLTSLCLSFKNNNKHLPYRIIGKFKWTKTCKIYRKHLTYKKCPMIDPCIFYMYIHTNPCLKHSIQNSYWQSNW